MFKGFGRICLAAFLLCILLVGSDFASAELNNNINSLRVHFIDVGQADCILVQSPDQKNMLIDAGNDTDGSKIVSYLKSQGVRKIDVLVATHPHDDHIGGMDTVIYNFDIGKMYMPDVYTHEQVYTDLLKAIGKRKVRVLKACSGMKINFSENLDTVILAPSGDYYEDINDYSAVIKVKYKSTSFLFTGDAGTASEKEMLSGKYDLSADVFKVGHHGSLSSTSNSFLKAVSPKYAVLTVRKNEYTNLPAVELLNKLVSAKAQNLRSDFIGNIVLSSDGKGVTFEPKTPVLLKTKAPTTKATTVYVNKTGKKYHTSTCKYVAKSKIPLTLKAAKVKGYTSCKVCNPPKK